MEISKHWVCAIFFVVSYCCVYGAEKKHTSIAQAIDKVHSFCLIYQEKGVHSRMEWLGSSMGIKHCRTRAQVEQERDAYVVKEGYQLIEDCKQALIEAQSMEEQVRTLQCAIQSQTEDLGAVQDRLQEKEYENHILKQAVQAVEHRFQEQACILEKEQAKKEHLLSKVQDQRSLLIRLEEQKSLALQRIEKLQKQRADDKKAFQRKECSLREELFCKDTEQKSHKDRLLALQACLDEELISIVQTRDVNGDSYRKLSVGLYLLRKKLQIAVESFDV